MRRKFPPGEVGTLIRVYGPKARNAAIAGGSFRRNDVLGYDNGSLVEWKYAESGAENY